MADIRTGDAAESVNEQIRDRSIRHLVWLTRLQTQEANAVTRFLNDEVAPDLEDQLRRRLERVRERGFDTGPQTTRRVEALISAVNEIASDGVRGAQSRLSERIQEIAQSEAEWQVGAIKESVPVSLEMVIPAPEQIRQAVTSRPFDGMPLMDWFEGLERQTRQNLAQAVRRGLVEGETVQSIVQRVRGTRRNAFTDGVLRTTTRNAEAIARTAVIHANTQARAETMRANEDVVKSEVWTSTLDTRTCPICAGRDGQQFDVGDGPQPPAHVGCRCTRSPVLKSWRELGIDADEMTESTRASMDGQVPGDITYNDWLRKRVNDGDMEIVREALGEKRAKLFAAGGMRVDKFTDRRGRMLTLRELRERERSTFEAAGVSV